jgi:hypothetical protein
VHCRRLLAWRRYALGTVEEPADLMLQLRIAPSVGAPSRHGVTLWTGYHSYHGHNLRMSHFNAANITILP